MRLFLLAYQQPQEALAEYKRGLKYARSKPVAGRYGLLSKALRILESEQPSLGSAGDSNDRATVQAIFDLLRRETEDARTLVADAERLSGRVWKWARIAAPTVQVYYYLSDYRNYEDVFTDLSVLETSRPGEMKTLSWTAKVGSKEMRWTTRTVEQSPHSRLSYLGSPPHGYSLTMNLVPVELTTVVLVQVSFQPDLVPEKALERIATRLVEGLSRMQTQIALYGRPIRVEEIAIG